MDPEPRTPDDVGDDEPAGPHPGVEDLLDERPGRFLGRVGDRRDDSVDTVGQWCNDGQSRVRALAKADCHLEAGMGRMRFPAKTVGHEDIDIAKQRGVFEKTATRCEPGDRRRKPVVNSNLAKLDQTRS